MTDSRPAHHTADGRFRNPWPGSPEHGVGGLWRWIMDRARNGRLFATPQGTPPASATPDIIYPRVDWDTCRITWVGHSSFLLQIDGLNVLTDPVWGDRASPISVLGPKRLTPPGIDFESLPQIDIVLQSHDHYDHFCDSTVRLLASHSPNAIWCAPLGVGAQLRERGVRHLVELDWFGSAPAAGGHVTCVPARHFAGRTINGRNRTLWCGWVLIAGRHRVYFVGDTGTHEDFAEIAQRCGPFDAVLMPIGAYDPRWFMAPVHMNPEEAVAAYGEIRTAAPSRRPVMVAMHWGTFVLTDEPVDEPPVRARAAWSAAGYADDELWIMRPGETRQLPR